MSDLPWDIHAARAALAESSRAQRRAQLAMTEAVKKAAGAEERYRKLLAVQIVAEHDKGVAWSVAADVARGEAGVARARYERDIAEGLKEAMAQAGWRTAADRKDAQRLSDWSQRQALADGLGTGMDVQWSKAAT